MYKLFYFLCYFFQKSSALTLLDQWEPNLVWMFLGVSCIEQIWRFFICRKAWPLLLKIEHRGSENSFLHISSKQIVLAYSTRSKSVHHDEIYLRLNFHFNLLSHVGVIASFQSFFAIFNVISFKNLLLWHFMTYWNQTWYECSLGYCA